MVEEPEVGVFPPKTDNEPLIQISLKIRQDLVEKLDWMGQREGYSRNQAFGFAAAHSIESYEKEKGITVQRMPIDSKKKRLYAVRRPRTK